MSGCDKRRERYCGATQGSWFCNLEPVDWGSLNIPFPWVKALLNVPLECGIGGESGAEEGSNLVPIAPLLGDADRRLVREQLERTMASDAFRGSKRSREFLSHIVERTLNGESDLLKKISYEHTTSATR